MIQPDKSKNQTYLNDFDKIIKETSVKTIFYVATLDDVNKNNIRLLFILPSSQNISFLISYFFKTKHRVFNTPREVIFDNCKKNYYELLEELRTEINKKYDDLKIIPYDKIDWIEEL